MRHIVEIFKKRVIACLRWNVARNFQILNSQQWHDEERAETSTFATVKARVICTYQKSIVMQ